MLEVKAARDIAAPARAVWSVLTNFAHYWTWNPFIQRARGSVAVGDKVRVHVRSSFGLPLAFRATVLDSEEDHELHWKGHFISPWLAAGEHWFTIERIDDEHVRFVQREKFSGIVPRLGARLLSREAGRGFAAMNDALARRAEASL